MDKEPILIEPCIAFFVWAFKACIEIDYFCKRWCGKEYRHFKWTNSKI